MSCKISISYTNNIETLFRMGADEAKIHNGDFSGDINSGRFNIPVLGGTFIGSYFVNGKTIFLEISKKPIFIPCSLIESFLKSHID